MNNCLTLKISGSMMLALALLCARGAVAQEFTAELGQPLEVIDGGVALDVTIPSNAPERTTYELPPYYAQPLLTEVPGKPFRQVDPPPQWPAFWKYPIYAGIGLPRDLFDGTIGFFRKVPLLSPALYVAYEKVPVQALMRDPRDWHRWDGKQNHNQHGFYDGSWYGFFPSAHTWHFKYPSNWAARRNARKNEVLQKELNQLNREIEAKNFKESEALRTARTAALEAINKGDGAEATKRMLPARLAYPQDEGIFALYVTALATYAGQAGAPGWVRPVLWRELNTAQPRPLDAAEQLLAATAKSHSQSVSLGEALVYARELQAKEASALLAAQAMAKAHPEDIRVQRIVLEAAISADKVDEARALWGRLQAQPAPDRELIEARLNLMEGHAEAAATELARLEKAHPENANYNYYLGAAQLAVGAKSNNRQDFDKAFENMEQAALQAPNTALRLRAGKALAYLRGVKSRIAENPELFSGDAGTTGTTAQQ